MKDTLIEIKNNLQGNMRIKSMTWNIRKRKTTNQKKQEKRIPPHKKMRIVSSLWDTFKCSDIHITEMSEGEEKEKEIGNLFEK